MKNFDAHRREDILAPEYLLRQFSCLTFRPLPATPAAEALYDAAMPHARDMTRLRLFTSRDAAGEMQFFVVPIRAAAYHRQRRILSIITPAGGKSALAGFQAARCRRRRGHIAAMLLR